MRDVLLFLSVFAACAVESVEALTIVLAVGLTRGWRSTLRGVAAGLVVLVAVVAALGPALAVVPINALRLVVGGLLLVFGLGWLRKAILRASGFKDRHDERAIFERERRAAEQREAGTASLIGDSYAFVLAFKGVVLEGLEVAFIVLTFGANQHNIPLAIAGAIAAIVLVTVAGVAVRAPLARVPENTLKFGVGVLLTAFGTFWGVEGAGGRWPGSDAALPVVIVFVAVLAAAATGWMRRVRTRQPEADVRRPAADPASGVSR
jgi:uncharacterized membrane protein